MPRLLILCEYATVLGGEGSMLATLPGLTAGGYDVGVAAPAGGGLGPAVEDRGACHLPLRMQDDRGERLALGALRAELAALIEREQPSLVHANSLSMSRIAGPVTADCGVPNVGHLRDIVKLSQQAVADVNKHRRIVAVSHATREFHLEQGIEASKTVVAYNGIDLSEYRPRPATGYLHRELGVSSGVRFIATIGQLGLRKGTEVALTAARHVLAEVPDVHWLIVGERTSSKAESREFEDALHAAANLPPLEGRVHFLGQRDDVSSLLRECVLLVHAARQEPLGRVLLESAASGLAVVATDVGGTREIFPSEREGAVLVRPDEPAELAAAISGLMTDDRRRAALARAGRQRAAEQFKIQTAVSRLLAIYAETLI